MKAVYQNSEEQHVSKYICTLRYHGAFALLINDKGERISKEDLFRMFCVGMLVYVPDDDAFYEADAYVRGEGDRASYVRFYDNEGSDVHALSDGVYLD